MCGSLIFHFWGCSLQMSDSGRGGPVTCLCLACAFVHQYFARVVFKRNSEFLLAFS